MSCVPVTTSSARYEVLIDRGLIGRLGEITVERLAPRKARRAFLAFDSNVPALVVGAASGSLRAAGLEVSSARLVATEINKSMTELTRLLAAIAESRHERFEPVIALGGGIVGDLAGFAAASYRRGVPVVQCPTTLLSMVDASVGGKTGVNLSAGGRDGGEETLKKNLVGAFHQPLVVLADVSTLDSLPDRHFRAGLAECIKHGMIAAGLGFGGGSGGGSTHNDVGLFDWTLSSMTGILKRSAAPLVELIRRNVAVKAAVVGTDEREELPSHQGGRALLNLGHTFGHAIETLRNLSPDGRMENAPLHHGEAVGIGLIAASHCAATARMCGANLPRTVESAVAGAGLPVKLAGLPSAERLLELMSHDKKVVGGKLRLVLPCGDRIGVCRVVEDLDPKAIGAGWDAVRV